MDLHSIAAQANANQVAIAGGGMATVLKLLQSHDIVFGIWADKSRAGGADFIVVKGIGLLERVVDLRRSVEMTWTAIPCTCLEQAVALRLVHGDK